VSRSVAPEPSSITHDRRELKYRLSSKHASIFAANVSARMPMHRFEGKGANRLPRARHYTTTVYFDTPTRQLYRAVCSDEDNLKVRAREYYDLHPELMELATDARDIVRYMPVLWIELKGKSGGRTYKRRIGIPKGDVSDFFEHGTVSQAIRDIQREKQGELADDVIEDLLALRTKFGEPLRASCLVNYRRTAFEDPAGSLRVTFDQRMACFSPADSLWQTNHALVRETLGNSVYEEPGYIMEIKALGELPEWLSDLLEETGAQQHGFSKFVTASEHVHGRENVREGTG
jgi:VTC domain